MRAAKRLMSRGCFAGRIVRMNSSGWRGSVIDYLSWQNSPELRKSVQVILRDWGTWSRGGLPRLDYPDHEPWTTPSEESKEARLLRQAVDVDQASEVEHIVSTLAAATCHTKLARLLVLRYVDGLQCERMAKAYNREFKCEESPRMIEARLDNAEWLVACLL